MSFDMMQLPTRSNILTSTPLSRMSMVVLCVSALGISSQVNAQKVHFNIYQTDTRSTNERTVYVNPNNHTVKNISFTSGRHVGVSSGHQPSQYAYSTRSNPTVIINEPVIIINGQVVRQQAPRFPVNPTPYSPWYSSQNAFKVARHPEIPAIQVNKYDKLKRGDKLSDELYRQGVIVYRAPRGIAIIRIGSTSIKFYEKSREIIHVINP